MLHAVETPHANAREYTRALLTIDGGESVKIDHNLGVLSRNITPVRRMPLWAKPVGAIVLVICCVLVVSVPPRRIQSAGSE